MTRMGRRLIEDFLLPALNEQKYGDRLCWVDKSAGYFSIRWSHKNAAKWTLEDTVVFQDWDKLKGHFHPEIKGYYMQAKQRFRAALYKLSSVRKVPSKDKHIKIYQLVQVDEKKKSADLPSNFMSVFETKYGKDGPCIPTSVICRNVNYVPVKQTPDEWTKPPTTTTTITTTTTTTITTTAAVENNEQFVSNSLSSDSSSDLGYSTAEETHAIDPGKVHVMDPGGTRAVDCEETHAMDLERTCAVDCRETHIVDYGETHAMDLGKVHAMDSEETCALDHGETEKDSSVCKKHINESTNSRPQPHVPVQPLPEYIPSKSRTIIQPLLKREPFYLMKQAEEPMDVCSQALNLSIKAGPFQSPKIPISAR